MDFYEFIKYYAIPAAFSFLGGVMVVCYNILMTGIRVAHAVAIVVMGAGMGLICAIAANELGYSQGWQNIASALGAMLAQAIVGYLIKTGDNPEALIKQLQNIWLGRRGSGDK